MICCKSSGRSEFQSPTKAIKCLIIGKSEKHSQSDPPTKRLEGERQLNDSRHAASNEFLIELKLSGHRDELIKQRSEKNETKIE